MIRPLRLAPALALPVALALAPALAPALARAEEPAAPSPALSVEQCWQDWLEREGLQEGENVLPDGRVMIAIAATDTIPAEARGAAWVVARNAVAGQLRLDALGRIAEAIRQKVETEASAEWLHRGVTPPEPIARAARAVSLAERARILAGHKLDDEIRKYDPQWNGEGRSDEERRRHAAVISTRYRERLSREARLLAAGATVVVQCEGTAAEDGTDAAGRDQLLLGFLWSPRLAYIAQNLARGVRPVDPGEDRRSLQERFAALSAQNPDWMATTLGVRVWTDENGEPVVVGFGAAPASRIRTLDDEVAHSAAIAAIARFAGEAIVASTGTGKGFEQKVFEDGSGRISDDGSFERRVESVSRRIELRGAHVVHRWRGRHPRSDAPMQVVAVAWKPSWSRSAEGIARLLDPASEGAGPALRNGAVALPILGGASARVIDY